MEIEKDKRNLKYEENFKKYLFKGDRERFKKVCESIGIKANINLLIYEI